MSHIKAKVDGKVINLHIVKQTPQEDGMVKVLVLAPGGSRSIVVEPEDIREDES